MPAAAAHIHTTCLPPAPLLLLFVLPLCHFLTCGGLGTASLMPLENSSRNTLTNSVACCESSPSVNLAPVPEGEEPLAHRQTPCTQLSHYSQQPQRWHSIQPIGLQHTAHTFFGQLFQCGVCFHSKPLECPAVCQAFHEHLVYYVLK